MRYFFVLLVLSLHHLNMEIDICTCFVSLLYIVQGDQYIHGLYIVLCQVRCKGPVIIYRGGWGGGGGGAGAI